MIRIFIGYDKEEAIAYHVLAHSLMRHATQPISITPLMINQLPMTREREPLQSTDFSFSRFLVPYLCGYEGHAIFMDSDMLCRSDITKLDFNLDAAISVVKHDYTPKTATKFLGNIQSPYRMKNWSSLMIFRNDACKALTPEYVNAASGMELHQFQWLNDAEIACLPVEWNHLVSEYEPNKDAKLVHYTLGTPCFRKYADCEFADEWYAEKHMMQYYNNRGEFSKEFRTGT